MAKRVFPVSCAHHHQIRFRVTVFTVNIGYLNRRLTPNAINPEEADQILHKQITRIRVGWILAQLVDQISVDELKPLARKSTQIQQVVKRVARKPYPPRGLLRAQDRI
jgi:hypothetical protein